VWVSTASRTVARLWVVAYAGLTAWFVPRARKRSHLTAETRSTLIGRVVDSYTA
jgi:ATP-binding cassette subfamily B multidrug efflux pump